MLSRYLIILLFGLAFFACKKQPLQVQWSDVNSGTDHDLRSVFFVNQDTGYICGGEIWESGIVLKTTDGGNSWVLIDNVINKILYSIFFINGDYGFAVGYDGKILRTRDGGQNWDLYQFGLWHVMYEVTFVNDSTGFIAGGRGYEDGVILKTVNGGNIWEFQKFPMALYCIFFVDEQYGWAGGYGHILRTTDGGITWDSTSASGDIFKGIHFVNRNIGYAVGYQGLILKTEDGGVSWKKIKQANSAFIKNVHFYDIFFSNYNKGYVVGNNGNILKTKDAGNNWTSIEPFTDKTIRSIYIKNQNSYIVTDDGEIYKFLE